MKVTFDIDLRVLARFADNAARAAEELRAATRQAVARQAELTRARAIARSPRNQRGRIAKGTRTIKLTQRPGMIETGIVSGSRSLGPTIFAIHGTERRYRRGQAGWLSTSIFETHRHWADGALAQAIRRELPGSWK